MSRVVGIAPAPFVGAAEGRPSILLQFVGAAVCFPADLVLWSFTESAPCVTAVAGAAAGRVADAEDAGHLPPGPSLCETMPKLFSVVDFPPSGSY